MHWFAEPLSALPMAIPPSKGRAARLHQDIHPMPGAYWKGYLRLSLVTCPIELFPATSQAEKTHFHQINTSNGHRLGVSTGVFVVGVARINMIIPMVVTMIMTLAIVMRWTCGASCTWLSCACPCGSRTAAISVA
ncbi:MAG TPA: hypothetical protein VGG45_02880, partial [Terracidiphilus sp.]